MSAHDDAVHALEEGAHVHNLVGIVIADNTPVTDKCCRYHPAAQSNALPTVLPTPSSAFYSTCYTTRVTNNTCYVTHLLNGEVGSLLCLKVHEAVALALACGVCGHLAGQDGAKLAEGVVQRLVVNGLVQVLRLVTCSSKQTRRQA
jgi:hypothetical protein